MIKIGNYKIAVYLINLDRCQDRLYSAHRELMNAKIPYMRFSAIDGRELNIEQLINDGLIIKECQNDANERKGSIGCYLSHVKIWQLIQSMSDNECDIGLIFEDDCIIHPNLIKKLGNILQSVPKDWDLLYLGSNKQVGQSVKGGMFIKPRVGNFKGQNAGMWGYMINKKHIQRWMSVMLPIRYVTKDPWIRSNFDKIRAYFLVKKLVFQNDKQFSSIRKYWH